MQRPGRIIAQSVVSSTQTHIFGEALKNPSHKDVLHGEDAASAGGFVQDVHP